MRFTMPVKLRSEANSGQGWKARHFRFKKQKDTVAAHMRQFMPYPNPPLLIRIVRKYPRPQWRMDGHDNLRSACKGIVDGITRELGIDDGDARLQFEYDQECDKAGHSVEIEITPV
jgi:hypothetical protein